MKVVRKIAACFLLILLCVPMTVLAAGETNLVGAEQTAGEMASAGAWLASAETTSAGAEQASAKTKSSVSTNANGVISTDDFEVRIVCGLDGNYRSGAAIPVTIYIESLNEDFEGTVRIIVPANIDYGTEAAAYEKDVMLSAGTQKIVTMSVYSSSGLTALKFQLIDAKDNAVIDKNVTMKSQVADSALVGVLSDDYTALNYFDGQGLYLDSYTGTVRLVELSEDIMPEQASGLEALSYLIINSYDTSKLSDAQYAAIKSWVDQGGILIIGTGSDYRQTLSGFQDDFVRGTIGDPIKGVFQLTSDKKSENAVKFTAEQGIVSLSLEEGAALDGIFTESDLIWNRDYGQGHVVVTAFNLGMEPIRSWNKKSEMASQILQNAAVGYSSSRIESLNYGSYSLSSWALSTALDALHDIKYPDMKLMAVLFLAFVILIGPGLYLILKLADKREWMWFLVPVLAVGFTAGVFGVSQDMRIKNPRESSVTTLYYDMDSRNGSEQVDMAIQAPNASEQEVLLDKSLSNLRLAVNDYYYSPYTDSQSDDQKYEYRTAVRETAEGYQLNIRNKSTFGSTYMNLSHIPDSAESCGLELNIDRKTTGISGTVTNNTGRDLHWVSIYGQSRVVMIGELKAGESAEIKESDNRYFEYDLYNISVPGYNDYDKEYNKQYNIWNLFCYRYLYSMGQSDIYAYASMDSWDADYIPDSAVKENNVAALVVHQTMGYSDYDGAQLLNLYDYAKNYGNSWDIDGQMYAQTAEVEFDLSKYVSNVHALIRAKDSEAPSYVNTKNVTVYGFNVETNQYDELFKDGETMEFEDGCPYLGEDGTIKLKFDCKTIYEDYSPQITVVGGED